ncbi:hypothetical protein MED222_06365 [Vibrio sp. MED222]|nr:hypothetical protein MED222_06365 [Vibrio sp. MED222]
MVKAGSSKRDRLPKDDTPPMAKMTRNSQLITLFLIEYSAMFILLFLTIRFRHGVFLDSSLRVDHLAQHHERLMRLGH